MKNKEIEELLKGMKDVSNTEGCSMNLDRYLVKLLLSYIEQLEKENKILKENAEHNDKVVDKVNWEKRQLENNRDKAIEVLEDTIEDLQDEPYYETIKYQFTRPIDILKGDSDE